VLEGSLHISVNLTEGDLIKSDRERERERETGEKKEGGNVGQHRK
jgi:hypothetical protein